MFDTPADLQDQFQHLEEIGEANLVDSSKELLLEIGIAVTDRVRLLGRHVSHVGIHPSPTRRFSVSISTCGVAILATGGAKACGDEFL